MRGTPGVVVAVLIAIERFPAAIGVSPEGIGDGREQIKCQNVLGDKRADAGCGGLQKIAS